MIKYSNRKKIAPYLSLSVVFTKTIILSANNLDEFNLKKQIKKSRKINLIFNNFYPSKYLNTLDISNFRKFCELSLEKFFCS